mmetsp:Transcript_18361/g.42351  ORF Transcript_18361/g.42351 Transcript_18361/m.42351 type:complete len:201 (-) Transcript_18361:332-934(-)
MIAAHSLLFSSSVIFPLIGFKPKNCSKRIRFDSTKLLTSGVASTGQWPIPLSLTFPSSLKLGCTLKWLRSRPPAPFSLLLPLLSAIPARISSTCAKASIRGEEEVQLDRSMTSGRGWVLVPYALIPIETTVLSVVAVVRPEPISSSSLKAAVAEFSSPWRVTRPSPPAASQALVASRDRTRGGALEKARAPVLMKSSQNE